MKIIVAKTKQRADYFCSVESDPPINPRAKDVIIVPTDSSPSRLHGLRLKADDEIIKYYDYYEGKYAPDVERSLRILEATREEP